MSDLNRLEDETRTETPTTRTETTNTPTETITETTTARADEPEVSTAGISSGAPGTEGVAPRKKRRRGTRGGQRRKKPTGADAVAGGVAERGLVGDDV